MRRSCDFEQAVRRGARGGRETLVVHLVTAAGTGQTGPVVGFVVSRAVGPAVTRNLVRRRLRALVHERLDVLPAGSRLVVRALPPAAGASYHRLGADLDAALATATRRALESAR
jgi:ribonuclease P protein component